MLDQATLRRVEKCAQPLFPQAMLSVGDALEAMDAFSSLFKVGVKGRHALLDLVHRLIPPENNLIAIKSVYEMEKHLSARTVCAEYEKIHSCPNDCILFINENSELEECPYEKCKEVRYQSRLLMAQTQICTQHSCACL
jgi:hypothetical protein